MYAVDTMGNPTDWNAAAVDAADRIQAHRFEEHNGAACWWKRGIFVAFGNDGYTQDEASRGAVDLLRQRLEDQEIDVPTRHTSFHRRCFACRDAASAALAKPV